MAGERGGVKLNDLHYWNEKYRNPIANPDTDWLDSYTMLFSRKLRILEVGCGAGELGDVLVNQKQEFTGFDFSKEAIEKAKLRVPTASWLVHDIRNPLPFADHCFDVVIASLSLHYFNDDILSLATSEIKRVLTPSGCFLFRMNAVTDPESIQPNQEIYRRYFNQVQIETWLDDWDIQELEERNLTYYRRPKWLWEGVAIPKNGVSNFNGEKKEDRKEKNIVYLDILANDDDDCLLYINGKAYNDIDYRWAECIVWLKDIISNQVQINLIKFDGERKDFPDEIKYEPR